jgi:hypothetical protein
MSAARPPSAPLLSIVIPTIGRETLEALLASIRCQAPASRVEILLVADTHSGFAGGLRRLPDVARGYAARYLPYDGGLHAWGHPQRTFGQRRARGAWLLFSQDDNAYCRGAFDAILARLAAAERPVLFRLDTWQAGLIWRQREVQVGNVDADMIAVPNDGRILPTWGTDYTADYVYIAAMERAYGVDWDETCIARGRPHERPYGRTFQSAEVAP